MRGTSRRTSSGNIKLYLGLLDGLPKIGIANRAGFDQLDRHTKKALQILLQSKVIVSMLGGTHRLELDKKIEVAGRGVKPAARCRAKQS